MNKKLFSLILVMVFTITPFLVYGATIKADRNYYLTSGQIVEDNLYTAGYNTNIAGEVYGDLFACGAMVNVSGYVDGDIASAAGTLNLTGNVLGDERVAGGNITISNAIGGDLMAFGGQINVMPEASIGKDAKIGGGTVSYDGNTNGNLEIMGGQVYINGSVDGDLTVKAEEIELGPEAVINGNFSYTSPKEAKINSSAVINGITDFTKATMPIKKEMSAGTIAGFVTMGLFIKLLIVVFAALLLMHFFKNQTAMVIKEALSNFWKKAGKGFILFVVIPVASMLLCMTVVGILVAAVTMLAYAIIAIIASVFAPLIFAKLSLKYVFKKEDYMLNWWIVVLSVIVLGILSAIPFIGWLFGFIIFLASLGSVADHCYKKLKD